MKLNIEIIFDNLSKVMPAELKGIRGKSLHLDRPEYYLSSERVFLTNHLYVVKGEHLPQRPKIEKGAALICIGNSMYLPYYLEHSGVIQIKTNADWKLIFNLLTGIYNKYDAWNDKLNAILNTSASVEEMVSCSHEIFDNPIFVLNANFHFLAHSDYSDIALAEWEKALSRHNNSSELALSDLSKYLEQHELSTDVKEPIVINLLDSSTLNINLFENGEYNGCLTIDYRGRKHRGSDDALAEHLARMIEIALRKYSAFLSNERSSLRRVLQDIIDGFHDDADQRRVLESAKLNREYICIKIKFSHRLEQLPIGYMCSVVEKTFPKSIAFEHDGAIIGFIETQNLSKEGSFCHQALKEQIMPLIASMDFDIGVSDPFSDIYSAQLYYLQTCSALENGKLFAPTEHFYLFQDYALMELIINALGKLPIEMYFSDGLRRLAEHDANSSVSYLQTLHTYLDNNMSITKTTSSLYINRSTLLERISRIKRVLNSDLQNADERLRLQIILKALEIHNNIQDMQKADG